MTEETGPDAPQTVLNSPTLSVVCQPQENLLLARITGRLDGNNAAAFRRALESLPLGNHRLCLLDMGGLSYISSDGLRVLLGYRRALADSSRTLALCSLPETIMTVFQISGFDRVMVIYPDARAASDAGNDSPDRG